MPNYARDPILLTPGPLTTSLQTKAAMLRDWRREVERLGGGVFITATEPPELPPGTLLKVA